jgi:site-specific DNA recombinase
MLLQKNTLKEIKNMTTKQTENKIKYIAYSRKSTESEDRQVLSLPDQKKELEEIIERYRLIVVDSYLGDKGDKKGESQSAHRRGRPTFGHVMTQIEAGKANGLLVWHVNRLARNAFDGGWIITAMDEGKLLEIKTPYKSYYNTPEDKFTLQLEFGMAKKSSDDNSVAVLRGLKTKVGMGWRPGCAPIGYKNSKDPELKGKNDIQIDPERFDIVRKMWDYMLTGRYTPPEILRIATDEWKLKTRTTRRHIGGTVARSHIYRVFTNPFYCGWFEYGKPVLQEDGTYRKPWYKGVHQPMITEEEFDIVQKLLKEKGRPRPQKHRFAFTGLMRCGNCGAMITAEEKIKQQKNGNIHHYVYYRCTKRKDENCPEKTIELKDLAYQIDEVISSITIKEDFKSYAMQYLHEVRTQEAKGFESIQESKQKELLRITKHLDQLFLKYTAPENANGEIIAEDEYQGLKQRLLAEKTQISTELEKHGKVVEDWLDFSERTFSFACYAGGRFARGTMEEKRAIFACLGSHLVVKDQKLNVELRKPFDFIFERLPKAEKELSQVRTLIESKNLLKQNNLALVAQNCSNWRR